MKKYKPTSAGIRWQTTSSFDEITKTKPEESLIIPRKRTGGRNVYGRITTRHIGGGHKLAVNGNTAFIVNISIGHTGSVDFTLEHYSHGAPPLSLPLIYSGADCFSIVSSSSACCFSFSR